MTAGTATTRPAGGGGDEGFRDAGSDGAEGGGAGDAEAVECVDNAHDGAEEAYKRTHLGDRSEPGHAALHERESFGGGGLGGAFEALGVGWNAAATALALVLVVDFVEDFDEGAGLELLGDGGDFAEAAGLAEGTQEAAVLLIRCFKSPPLGEHDRPGDDAHEQQQAEHGERGGAAVVQHFDEGAGGLAVGCWTEGGVGGDLGGGVLEEESEGEKGHRRQIKCNWR